MDIELDYYFATAILLFGLATIGIAGWIDHRRAERPMPSLVPMTPILLLGTILVLTAVVYFINTLQRGHSGYYIAAALVLFGASVIAITVLIERQRRKNPRRSLSSTTPFLFLGAIVVLVGIVLFLSVGRDESRKSPRRGSLSSLVNRSMMLACPIYGCRLMA
jgi:FtsH-binding integral membrane protein